MEIKGFRPFYSPTWLVVTAAMASAFLVTVFNPDDNELMSRIASSLPGQLLPDDDALSRSRPIPESAVTALPAPQGGGSAHAARLASGRH